MVIIDTREFGKLTDAAGACEALGISRPTLDRRLRDGTLAAVGYRESPLNRKKRLWFRLDDLSRFLTRGEYVLPAS